MKIKNPFVKYIGVRRNGVWEVQRVLAIGQLVFWGSLLEKKTRISKEARAQYACDLLNADARKPIRTAPCNGTPIYVERKVDGQLFLARWDMAYCNWHCLEDIGGWFEPSEVSHWRSIT